MMSRRQGQQHGSSQPSPHGSGDPIYIVGLDRSGKTTMRAFLASHSRIAIPAVGSNMWTYFYRRFGALDNPANLDRCLEEMSRYKHVRFLEPDFARIRREFAEGPTTYGRLFSLFLIHNAEREGKPRWGAQSGLVEQYADEMFASYPGLKMIHMVRDPRDRYEASLAKWPDGRGRAGGAAARWRFSMRLAQRNVDKHPDNYLVVRFEDLVASSTECVRTVCEFLGEQYEPAMMAMGAAADFRRSRATEPDGDQTVPVLSREYVGRFRGRVPELELAFIELHVGRMMRRYGYPAEAVELSLTDRMRFAAFDWPRNYTRYVAWLASEAAHRRLPRVLGHEPGRRMRIDPDVAGTTRAGSSASTDRSGSNSVAGS
jgi:hypothetical protein